MTNCRRYGNDRGSHGMTNPKLGRVIDDLEASREVFTRAIGDQSFVEAVARTAELVVAALRAGGKVLFAGNGGSAADAQHLACELVVRMNADRAALPAIALTTDSSILTAAGNDLGFEQIFARQVHGLGRAGDVFVGISTSGRSPNILAACRAARERGMTVVGFTGSNGGTLGELCDVVVRVPSDKTPFIQQVHIAAGHIVCAIAEEAAVKSRRN
jgi:D-sedoheptulose 7-phosphate isomerase